MSEEMSLKEERVRAITNLYYSRKDVQEAIFNFCKNREISPRYFEGFGKRPDVFQYKNDVMGLVKKGATSFHCSEEIWEDPMDIFTGMTEEEANELRGGWDLLIDIDSKYIDYSKISAQVILKMLRFHGVKNVGIKFSGSKGFHLVIPWKAFPKEVNGVKTKDKFPEWPRIIMKYIMEKTNDLLVEKITDIERKSKYVKDDVAGKEVAPDLVLVSPRHLFRTPYSLHEKTALASVVLSEKELEKFELLDAKPLKVKVKNFYPDCEEGEASELLLQALDWNKEVKKEDKEKKFEENFKAIKLENLSVKNFPPCVKKILEGVSDGRKRAVFILINLFRSVGVEKEELEQRIKEWNKKNSVPLKWGYIKSQLDWTYKRNPIMPPNCKEYYKGIGVCDPDNYCKFVKNPVNYTIKKSLGNKKK